MKNIVNKICSTPVALIIAASLFLSACGDQITRENYAKIETGMSQEDVFKVLGEPDEYNSVELGELSGGTGQWNGSKQVIKVTFTNEKVAFKRIAVPEENE